MPQSVVTVSYLIAGVLFILSLGGLSAQESARRGNLFGIAGMAIAIVATMFGPAPANYGVQLTAMPQLVAMLHSFVGAAAVLVGFAITLQGDSHFTSIEATIHRVETF